MKLNFFKTFICNAASTILAIFLLQPTHAIHAQHTDSIKIKPFKYILTEAGISHVSFLDMGVSPLIYSGSMPEFTLGYKATKPFYILETDLSVKSSNLSTQISNTTYNARMHSGKLHLNYFRKAGGFEENSIGYFFGAGVSYDIWARILPHLMNSQFSMNNNFSLSLNTRLQYDFTLKPVERKILFFRQSKPVRNYSIFLNLLVPFSSLHHAPGFAGVSHATTNNDNEFEYYKWHVLLFTGLNLKAGILKFLPNGNAWGMHYTFSLFSSKNFLNNYYQQAQQTLSISLQYRFK